jgi:hypothetical protein
MLIMDGVIRPPEDFSVFADELTINFAPFKNTRIIARYISELAFSKLFANQVSYVDTTGLGVFNVEEAIRRLHQLIINAMPSGSIPSPAIEPQRKFIITPNQILNENGKYTLSHNLNSRDLIIQGYILDLEYSSLKTPIFRKSPSIIQIGVNGDLTSVAEDGFSIVILLKELS